MTLEMTLHPLIANLTFGFVVPPDWDTWDVTCANYDAIPLINAKNVTSLGGCYQKSAREWSLWKQEGGFSPQNEPC